MQTIYSVNELAERWGLAPASIRRMEQEGTLHRLPDIPGVRFSAAEVLQLESIGLDAKAMSAWERRNLESEIHDLKQQVQDLQGRLLRAQQVLQGGAV